MGSDFLTATILKGGGRRCQRICVSPKRRLTQIVSSFPFEWDRIASAWAVLPACGCGILTFESRNLPTRLRNLLRYDSRAETAFRNGTREEIKLGMVSPIDSFTPLRATCSAGGAHRRTAWPQPRTGLLSFAPPASLLAYLSPARRGCGPCGNSGCIHEPVGRDELR